MEFHRTITLSRHIRVFVAGIKDFPVNKFLIKLHCIRALPDEPKNGCEGKYRWSLFRHFVVRSQPRQSRNRLRMLRYSANENAIRNALSQSLSFPVPLDKGNAGSGNEIGQRHSRPQSPRGFFLKNDPTADQKIVGSGKENGTTWGKKCACAPCCTSL